MVISSRIVAFIASTLVLCGTAFAQYDSPAVFNGVLVAPLTAPSAVMGSATGGNQGPGTLNATGLYVNGVPVGNSSGTVSSASVVTANGFGGTFATPTSTPALTLTTTVTGLVMGNGTGFSGAVAGTDYLRPNGSAALLTGLPIAGISGLGTNVAPAIGNPINAVGGLLTYGIVGTAGATIGLLNANKTDSGNNTFSGGLTLSGTVNATGTTGYQISGANAILITGATTPQGQGVFVGPYAGLNAPSSMSYGTVGIGAGSLMSMTASVTEATCGGALSCQYLTTAQFVTAWGEHTVGFDNTGSTMTAIGEDAQRDTIGCTNCVSVGSSSEGDGVGYQNTTIGTLSLRGNAGSITVGGTKTTGDVLSVTFSSTDGNISYPNGNVASYTVLAGDTLTTIPTGLLNAIGALAIVDTTVTNGTTVGAFSPPFALAANGTVIALHFPGGVASGWKLTPVASCTGTCTETLTVSAPFSGNENLAEGFAALHGSALTGATANIAIGDYAFANLAGAPNGMICIGVSCGFLAWDSANGGSTLMGFQAGYSSAHLINEAFFGYQAGYGVNNGQNDTIFGAANGNINCITTGNYGIEIGSGACVPSATATGGMSIGNIIYGTGNSGTLSTLSTGQIGIGTKAPNATLTIGDAAGNATFGSHIGVVQTTPPVVTGGATTGTLDATATDTKGTITGGTLQTGAVITFNKAFATVPDCTVTSPGGSVLTSYTPTTTALTLVNPSLTGAKYTWTCLQ